MDLNKLTKAQLIEQLATYGVTATNRARKATLVALLEEKMANVADIEAAARKKRITKFVESDPKHEEASDEFTTILIILGCVATMAVIAVMFS